MAKLVMRRKGTEIKQYALDKELIRIGRAEGNDLVIDDPLLSRSHAVIVAVGAEFLIEDRKSSNGTFVNGTRITRQTLKDQDEISLGKLKLSFIADDNAIEADEFEAPAQPQSVSWPNGRVRRISIPASEKIITLDRVVTTFGTPTRCLAVITRRPHGYSLAHIAGHESPHLNRESIGTETRELHDGDLIEIGDEAYEFHVDVITS